MIEFKRDENDVTAAAAVDGIENSRRWRMIIQSGAVTFAFAATTCFPWIQVPLYMSAQFVWVVLAAFVLHITFPGMHDYTTTMPGSSGNAALVVEFVSSFTMMFVASAVATGVQAAETRCMKLDLGSAEVFLKESQFLLYGNGKEKPATGLMFGKEHIKALYFNQTSSKIFSNLEVHIGFHPDACILKAWLNERSLLKKWVDIYGRIS